MMKTTVLIADSDVLFRNRLNSLLQEYDDVEVVGEAGQAVEVPEKVLQLHPDVLLIDIDLPLMAGLDAISRISQEKLRTKVLALTQHEESEYILMALRAGAKGYLPKMTQIGEIVSAIRTVHRGDSYLCPSAATVIVTEILKNRGE